MSARAVVVVGVVVAVVGAAAVLVQCTGDDAAGGADAAGDVRYGVWPPRDAGGDGAAGDANADGSGACSVTSDWPGFRRLTEFDPCAPADVLVDPDAGYTMSWTDCGDAGIAGCEQITRVVPQQFMYAYATHDGSGSGKALYLVQGFNQSSTVRQFDIVDIATSSRLGEWRIDEDPVDIEVVLANAPDYTTAFLGWHSGNMYADFAPAQTLFNANPMTLKQYPAPGQDINWAVSPQVMAFQPFSAQDTICQVEAGTCAPLDIKSMPGTPYYAFAWHDVVFAVDEHGSAGWAQEYVIHADGSIALLRSNPNAHIWGMTTDGTTLVWEETYGTTDLNGTQTRTEIWKAPFTTDKATLDATATKVTTLPTAGLGGVEISELDFFNGLYSTFFGGYPYQYKIYTVDIATGQVQSSPTGPGGIVLGLPYVDRNELWEVTSTLNYHDYLTRIPFAQPWK